MKLKLGEIVNYRTEYATVPAIVTCTADTINKQQTELFSTTYGARGVPPLSDDNRVHLTVFDPEVGAHHDELEDGPQASCYRVWDVPESSFYPKNGVADPGTWFVRE